MFNLNVRALVTVMAATILGAVGPASAHHAADVGYSADKELLLTGTLKEFRYSNPHAVIQLVVSGSGQAVEWTVLTESPIELNKSGIEKSTFQPGEPVTIRVRPSKSGNAVGWLLDVRKQDGTFYSVDE